MESDTIIKLTILAILTLAILVLAGLVLSARAFTQLLELTRSVGSLVEQQIQDRLQAQITSSIRTELNTSSVPTDITRITPDSPD